MKVTPRKGTVADVVEAIGYDLTQQLRLSLGSCQEGDASAAAEGGVARTK